MAKQSVAQRYGADLLLIGIALGRSDDRSRIGNDIEPLELSTAVTRELMLAVMNGDRCKFASILLSKFGIEMEEGERAVDSIVRSVKDANDSDHAMKIVNTLSKALAYGMDTQQVLDLLDDAKQMIED